ncbi:PR domain zinc finger protein 10-like isoform X3 [Dysidea avara]|uniref:PR domain zinc finger protein 10-like isoform X3 n=1 Tax=Dysidea avara TaxID=196820 RepID=UPI00332419F1
MMSSSPKATSADRYGICSNRDEAKAQESEDCDSVYTPVKKKQKIMDNDMDWTRGGVVKLKDFSIRLTPLKDIPTTLKPHHPGNTGDDNVDSSIDGVIFCVACDKSYHGDCPVHGPLIPLDESQGWDQDSKSFTSVPVPLQVTVKMSSIMNAGKGVFAKEFIPRRTRIGPYKGEVVQKEDVTDETDTSYFWEVKKGREFYYIDAKNEEHASWLRFINCARNEEEQNLLSFQYQRNIYCYTIKDILPGTELLVWYGEQYVKLLGLTVDYVFGEIMNTHTRKQKHSEKSVSQEVMQSSGEDDQDPPVTERSTMERLVQVKHPVEDTDTLPADSPSSSFSKRINVEQSVLDEIKEITKEKLREELVELLQTSEGKDILRQIIKKELLELLRQNVITRQNVKDTVVSEDNLKKNEGIIESLWRELHELDFDHLSNEKKRTALRKFFNDNRYYQGVHIEAFCSQCGRSLRSGCGYWNHSINQHGHITKPLRTSCHQTS